MDLSSVKGMYIFASGASGRLFLNDPTCCKSSTHRPKANGWNTLCAFFTGDNHDIPSLWPQKIRKKEQLNLNWKEPLTFPKLMSYTVHIMVSTLYSWGWCFSTWCCPSSILSTKRRCPFSVEYGQRAFAYINSSDRWSFFSFSGNVYEDWTFWKFLGTQVRGFTMGWLIIPT